MTSGYQSPLVDSIALGLIDAMYQKKLRFSKKEVLDSDCVPSLSESAMIRRGFRESIHHPSSVLSSHTSLLSVPVKIPIDLTSKELLGNGAGRFGEGKNEHLSFNNRTEKREGIQKKGYPGPQGMGINLFLNPPRYGKLDRVMRDPFVSYIDCPGPNQRIVVTKNNQKQQTNIVLTKAEIQILLNSISSKTKIPLVSGIFRVSWDRFVINAVVSEVIEPRFIIKRGI
jgi:hypothetical protein